jgi:hypothetical protein
MPPPDAGPGPRPWLKIKPPARPKVDSVAIEVTARCQQLHARVLSNLDVDHVTIARRRSDALHVHDAAVEVESSHRSSRDLRDRHELPGFALGPRRVAPSLYPARILSLGGVLDVDPAR